MTDKNQLAAEIEALEKLRDFNLLESKAAYFLYKRNNAKVAFHNCIQELAIKRKELRSL